MSVYQRRLFFIISGLALLLGSNIYGNWQLGGKRLWENTFLQIFTPSAGPKTSSVFSAFLWTFGVLIILPSLAGWGAFRFLYHPIMVYEWKFISRRKAYVKSYDSVERSFGVGVLPFLCGFSGQIILGYLVGLAIPLSITMPLGSTLLSIGCFGLLTILIQRIRRRRW